MNAKLKRGYIQVYTGSGKGKTSAVFGLALRAWGQGLRVYIVQFMKKNPESGEIKAAKRFTNRFTIKQFGTKCFIKNKPSSKDIKSAEKGFFCAERAVNSGKYDMVILDEINCALKWKLIKSSPVKQLIKNKPHNVELIFSGRYAPKWLMRQADLVTEMKEIKHYFSKKIQCRRGIEY